MKITEHKIVINGLKINYAKSGDGNPMIFLSNGGGFWQIWYYQIKYFARRYKVYAIEWPGCGESELTYKPFTLDLLTAVLEEFIKTLNLRDVILIGNCVGSATGLNYTIKYPHNVDKLIISNICPGDRIFPSPFLRKLIGGYNPKKKAKNFLSYILKLLIISPLLNRKYPRKLFGFNFDKSSFVFKKYKRKLKDKKQAVTRINILFGTYTFNLVNYLGAIKAPEHLLIWGKQNQVASIEIEGQYHYNLLQSSSLKVIENAGHMCMCESPDEVNEIIQSYILQG